MTGELSGHQVSSGGIWDGEVWVGDRRKSKRRYVWWWSHETLDCERSRSSLLLLLLGGCYGYDSHSHGCGSRMEPATKFGTGNGHDERLRRELLWDRNDQAFLGFFRRLRLHPPGLLLPSTRLIWALPNTSAGDCAPRASAKPPECDPGPLHGGGLHMSACRPHLTLLHLHTAWIRLHNARAQ